MENKFLNEILGEEAAEQLLKAVDKFPLLKSILLPRAVVSWVSTMGRLGYEGGLPGNEISYFSLQKNADNTYTGALTINDELYTFDKADLLHVSASVGVALKLEAEPVNEALQKKDLSDFGDSIDLLIKSNIVKKLRKQKELSKDESDESKMGKPAGNLQPMAPQKPVSPTKGIEKPKPNMAVSQPKLKVTKSESTKLCNYCGDKYFNADEFVACACLKDLAKHVKTEVISDGYMLNFNRAKLDEDAVMAIINIFKV